MRDEVLVPGSAAKVTAKVEQKRKKKSMSVIEALPKLHCDVFGSAELGVPRRCQVM